MNTETVYFVVNFLSLRDINIYTYVHLTSIHTYRRVDAMLPYFQYSFSFFKSIQKIE